LNRYFVAKDPSSGLHVLIDGLLSSVCRHVLLLQLVAMMMMMI